MNERRFNREIERLRDPDRIARLEVDRVASLVLNGMMDVRTILDIGTGSGIFAEKFSKIGMAVTGLDVNPEMLFVAKTFVPDADFQEGVVETLPFGGGKFDLVFMGLLLHETDDASTALQEAYRVTRKRLAILEWPYEEQDYGPPLEHRLSKETIVKLAEKAGFGTVNTIMLESLVLYLLVR
jgi:ubiquinone/menaquinone biosynthesis C-methylase UbiE